MNQISIVEAPEMTSPNPITLVCTEMSNGDTNLAPISWWTYLSFAPAKIGIAIGKLSYSGEMLRKTSRMIITVPSAEIADSVFLCGTVSGSDTNKAAKFSIELKEIPGIPVKIPVHSRLALDCRLTDTMDVGDHYLYICSVDGVYADESKEPVFAWGGYRSIKPISLCMA